MLFAPWFYFWVCHWLKTSFSVALYINATNGWFKFFLLTIYTDFMLPWCHRGIFPRHYYFYVPLDQIQSIHTISSPPLSGQRRCHRFQGSEYDLWDPQGCLQNKIEISVRVGPISSTWQSQHLFSSTELFTRWVSLTADYWQLFASTKLWHLRWRIFTLMKKTTELLRICV